jgi:urate oxidase
MNHTISQNWKIPQINIYFRCLPDAEDRIFSTIVDCSWTYKTTKSLNFCQAFNEVSLPNLT